MPRYLKSKVEIAQHFGVNYSTVKEWANKEWWIKPTKQGWNLERLENLIASYKAVTDTRGRAIPSRSTTGGADNGDDLATAKLAAEVFKLQQEGEAKKLKNDLAKKNLLDAHTVRQWIAERFLRIKQRIESIPDEMQLIAPTELRPQFRSDMQTFVYELLLEMSSFKFDSEVVDNDDD